MPNRKLESSELVMNAAATPSSAATMTSVSVPRMTSHSNPARLSAESHPQPELGGALRDRIGDDTVDADAGEQQREPAEAAGQQRQQALVDEPLVTLRRRAF